MATYLYRFISSYGGSSAAILADLLLNPAWFSRC